MCPRLELRAAGLVIFRKISSRIEFLLMQTSYGEHHWTPPKGHVDPGENDMQTAIRETREEAGLRREDYVLFENFRRELRYDVKNKQKTVIYWLAEIKDVNKPIIMSDEHQAFKWLPLQEAQTLSKYMEMKELLKDCDNFIQEQA